jgi:N-methylhydantoinase A
MRRIAVDIGGTFTDIVYLDDDAMVMIADKVRSTPADVGAAVLAAIRKIDVDLADVDLVVQGTTVGLNAVTGKTGAKVGLLFTRKGGDRLGTDSGELPDGSAVTDKKLESLVPGHLWLGVDEETDPQGAIVRIAQRRDLQAIVKTFRDNGVEAIAVCLRHANVNPANERAIGEMLRELWPGIPVSFSHQMPLGASEYDRLSTTVLDAYITPVVARYLNHMRDDLANLRFKGQLRIVGAGGIQGVEATKDKSIVTFAAGSSGGLSGAARVARALDIGDVLVMDAGGTSFDISLIKNGVPLERSQTEWMGHPVLLEGRLDVRSIGAGGGSIARLDAAGQLTVGAESAGADPGPMCYGRGGVEPTVTDAALVNGLLDPSYFLGGEMALDKDLAFQGVQKIADRMGVSVHAAAEAILNVAGDTMSRAARELLIGQGHTPRDFALLSCGGAGGLFAAKLLHALAMPQLIIPPHPGVYSAHGTLTMDVVHDMAEPYARPLQSVDLAELGALYDAMQQNARRMLAQEGIADDAVHFIRTVEMGGEGQEGCVAVSVPTGPLNEESRRQMAAGYHERHQIAFGRGGEAVPRIVTVRLKAVGKVEEVPLEPSPPSSVNIPPDAFKGARMVYANGRHEEWVVLERAYLLPANSLIGPLIVEERQHTTVVLPGQHFMVDAYSNLVIRNPKATTA